MERQAGAFYRRFAKQAQSNDVKALCLQLADEEVEHFNLIDNQLSRWKSLPVSKSDLETMDVDGKLRKMFLSPPSFNSTNKKIIEYAIDQEKKMVAFYESFEKEFTDWWKSTKLEAMVVEEKTHIKKLTDMKSRL
jgi:rubrerythrin